jgi:hypothetical protein
MHVRSADGRYEVGPQQVMSCNDAQRGCQGGIASDADNVWSAKGITKDRDSPYKCGAGSPHNHFEAGHSCEAYPWGEECKPQTANAAWTYVGSQQSRSENLMKQAVVMGLGSYASFIVYANFMAYTSGVYTASSGERYGGHAVAVVGYGLSGAQKYWILQNSWGPHWGEHGFFRFARGADLCFIESRQVVTYNATVALIANPGESPQEQAISDETANVDLDVVVARCNSYTCPSSYYLRVNAPTLLCKGETCNEADDKGTCCKALTKEVSNAKCQGSQALNWFEQYTLADCVEWALNNGVSFFVYGKGIHAQKCWWQKAYGPEHCEGRECCACTNCAWEDDEYDFYKLM